MDEIEYLLQNMPEEYKEELEACKSRLSNAMSISTTHTQE